jgi:hypothetical protein
VVVAVGVTVRDPEAPDAEKPVPLQVLAFALLHMSVEDWPLAIERPKAERVAVGAGAVAACATTIAEGFVDCEIAPTLCAGTICGIARPSAVAGGDAVVIGVAFGGMLELGDELTACPETTSGEKSKPSMTVVNTVKRTIRLYLKNLELDLTRNLWK